VRREAGRWLTRLRGPAGDILFRQGFGGQGGQKTSSFAKASAVAEAKADMSKDKEDREVIHELQRLRYGPRETWPEPRRVFKRARRVSRGG